MTALTESRGVVSAMARNAIQSRRFGGALDLFTASEWTIVEKSGAELLRLDEAVVRRSFDGIRGDFEKLALASVFNELILRMGPKAQGAPELFRIHSNALATLEEAPATRRDGLCLLNAYLIKLLHWNGLQPRLTRCLQCELGVGDLNDTHVGIRVEEAGWVCRNCHAALEPSLTIRSLHDAIFALTEPIRRSALALEGSEVEQEQLFGVLEQWILFHVPGMDQSPLQGLRFLQLRSRLSH